MKVILKKISEQAIKLNDPFNKITEQQKELEWLGTSAAKMEEIEMAEKKLSVIFPDDYKNFLMITNGFTSPINVEPTFEKVSNIDFLKNINPHLVKVWNDGELVDAEKKLSRSILIAGINEEQYFLLIPPTSQDEKWEYWKFANWIPGEEPYEDLETYFGDVLTFIEEKS
jgi:cell wall assembly regulator SMI1